MTEITWGIRKIDTKEIIVIERDETKAVNFAGKINKKSNEEIVEVVKIITTQTIVSLQAIFGRPVLAGPDWPAPLQRIKVLNT